MGEAVAALLWALIELLLIVTGKFVVTAVSWGRWRGERLNSKEDSIYGPAGALSFKREGQRVITANGLLIAGVLFYVLLGFALCWVASWA